MRGRNNNNRKGPNPLTRSYESNGPDVKIRGTAQHIAEKYLQLARDAQSSGDTVAAESYLQHAEHYFRLIAAAQQAQAQAQFGYQRQPGEPEADDAEDDDDFAAIPDRFASPLERSPPQAATAPMPQPPMPQNFGGDAQPYGNGQPGERPQHQERQPHQNRQPYGERQPYQDRAPRQDRPYQERQPFQERQQDRPYQDRQGRNNFRDGRPQREPRPFRERNDQSQPRFAAQQPELEESPGGLPAFITAPTRVNLTPEPEVHEAEPPVREEIAEASPPPPAETPAAEPPQASEESVEFPVKVRRRRGRPPRGGWPEEQTNEPANAGDVPVE
ncbi:DUF4167 domain-containing protein [Methylovirgula sp. 4M-Z18]|uniref:DUF4167 domain-containing protein n=1 Tax=Methylovirgula sp. 4M-Z18 TaxID=2293567 RepID=UPI000E2E8DD9|nr:DUF4167 domain-containing protein [Methylovirgula sp. 4M-Z18]RFB81226.1 DUF4167 domain-containing protein [Methylovirgula sp. 4M-Z18]